MMPNLVHVAEYLGGGLGLIVLGWVLRWGQHRDDCRASLLEEYGYGRHDGYGKGWDDALQSVELTGVLLGESAGYDVPGLCHAEGRIGEPAGLAAMPAGLGEPGHPNVMTDEEYEVYAQSHVISQELAALAAVDVPRPGTQADHGWELANSASGIGEAVDSESERDASPGPGHLESTQEWQARMDLEAAQWCARHGLRHESAWAA